MAWPADNLQDNVDTVFASHINNIVQAVKKWEGDVDANDKALSNLRLLGMRGAAGTPRAWNIFTNAALRWQVEADASAELGANAGSDFTISRFSDAGGYLDTPLKVRRTDGAVFVAGNFTVGAAVQASTVRTTEAIYLGATPGAFGVSGVIFRGPAANPSAHVSSTDTLLSFGSWVGGYAAILQLGLADRNVTILGGGWNNGHLNLGGYHVWVDAGGNLRIKGGAPTSDGDGVKVGAQ